MERKEQQVTVDRILDGQWGKSALLRQEVIRVYPGARGGTSKSDGLYGDSEFGKDRVYTSARFALVKVPASATIEEVQARLARNPKARLYRIVSNSVLDILTDEQKMMMNRPGSTVTVESYQDAYEVQDSQGTRYPDTSGRRQFHRNFLSLYGKGDVNLLKPTTVTQTVQQDEYEPAVEAESVVRASGELVTS